MAAALLAQQFAPVDGIGPVVAAGVGHGQNHLAVAGDGLEKFQHLQRHLGQPQQQHAPGNGQAANVGGAQGIEHLLAQGRAGDAALLRRQVGQHGPPQGGLPFLAFGQGGVGLAGQAGQVVAPGLPGQQPVAAIDLVLVKQVGQAAGQLQQALGLVVAQKAGDGGKGRQFEAGGQQAHQPPGHGLLIQRREAGHALRPQNLPPAAPQKPRGQLHPRGRANALVLGLQHLEPFGRAVALHQHDFLLQRAQGVGAAPVDQGLGQGFGAVAVQGEKAGGQGRAGHWGVGLMHRAHPLGACPSPRPAGAAAAPAPGAARTGGDSIAPGRAGWRCPSTGGRALAARG